MTRLVAAFALCAATPGAASDAVFDVPSGQQVSLHEVLIDAQDDINVLRFRFLAPQIGREDGQIGFDVAGEDMRYLCEALALGYIADFELEADRIIVSLMDRVTEFAVPDPDATQYFEAFRPVDGSCMWDEF